MFKLLMLLQDRNISYDDLYRSFDANNDGEVNVKELEKVLIELSKDFYQKEIEAIHSFFDVNRDDTCSKKEFISQFDEADRLF